MRSQRPFTACCAREQVRRTGIGVLEDYIEGGSFPMRIIHATNDLVLLIPIAKDCVCRTLALHPSTSGCPHTCIPSLQMCLFAHSYTCLLQAPIETPLPSAWAQSPLPVAVMRVLRARQQQTQAPSKSGPQHIMQVALRQMQLNADYLHITHLSSGRANLWFNGRHSSYHARGTRVIGLGGAVDRGKQGV